MYSILIPIYNRNSVPLITTLQEELRVLNITYQILCIDDASPNLDVKKKNKALNNFENCEYIELQNNVGRSRIRNLLAEKAMYDNLIFLDNDVIPVFENFIKNYINALENNQVVFGGIKYPSIPKSNAILHHKYGNARETKLDFTTANFAIKKEVFKKVKFDETFKEYGFEDLLFYKSLTKKGVLTVRIDNPVYHYGIVNDNQLFIKKEEQSLKTLNMLFLSKKISQKEVKLLRYYMLLKKLKKVSFYKFLTKKLEKKLIKNLTSANPSLFLFDIYRLGFFCRLPKN